MGVHGVAATGAREGRVDPLLADRVVEALLLVGLPVAHGGHGPGVHLLATEGAGDSGGFDADRWPVTLRWICSPRLEGAAAASDARSPWPRTRQVVADSMETALAELLPALGLHATRATADGPTLVGPGDHDAPARAAAGGSPAGGATAAAGAEADPSVGAAVRRGAALAGLPLARGPRTAGVAYAPCGPAADTADAAEAADGQATAVVDVTWQPSPHLPGTPLVATAVREAMHHAVGTALAVCGLRTSWHRPADSAPHLHVADH
ncbi:hypothetical protein Kpho02_71510 [Kitasatospora phosalacinea]|uniref:Uncharacterized protein n=1 Tax=Kitasatospora phosalacinea TaxID=2065 RepID=A0A9W6V3X1_9ACTN|nr:hypothetical protein [Kitasatospora phosalacinea]GLW74854.1 hypothetical protein Kpho02_71510 [Kitasatospora phosalacinea]